MDLKPIHFKTPPRDTGVCTPLPPSPTPPQGQIADYEQGNIEQQRFRATELVLLVLTTRKVFTMFSGLCSSNQIVEDSQLLDMPVRDGRSIGFLVEG